MTHFAFTLDVDRCSGCRACVVACLDQNDHTGAESVSFRHVTKDEMGAHPDTCIAYFSIACQHCGDAPCAVVCPTRAISRRETDGAVVVARDLCIGCHSCELACPFGAPKFLSDGLMAKCDLCHVRRDHGLAPACVQICPTRALDCRPIEAIAAEKAEAAAVHFLRSLVHDLPRGRT